MRRKPDRFQMTEELGKRLKSLRRRAGMTQSSLAKAVGASWDHALVSRLESGDYSNPGLGMVADYLRACRADFDDILDLLKEYTSRRRPDELAGREAVVKVAKVLPDRYGDEGLKYDAKVAAARQAAGEEPLSPEERVRRMVNLAASAGRRQRLKVVTNVLLDEIETSPNMTVRVFVEQLARKAWGVMSGTRTRNRHMRDHRMARLVGESTVQKILPFSDVQLVVRCVSELFDGLVMTGKLPMPDRASRPRRVRIPTHEEEEQERVREAGVARQANISEGLYQVMTVLQPRRLAHEMDWYTWLTMLCSEAYDTLPGSPERERIRAESLAKSPDPAVAGEYADLALRGLDRQLRRGPKPDEGQLPT